MSEEQFLRQCLECKGKFNMFDSMIGDYCFPCCSKTSIRAYNEYLEFLDSKKKSSSLLYLVTFTRNPNSRYSYEDWIFRIKKECMKNFVVSVKVVKENADSNVHVHAVMLTNKRITKREFKVFNRDYGYVDVRRIKSDNGVMGYIEKDLEAGETSLEINELK